MSTIGVRESLLGRWDHLAVFQVDAISRKKLWFSPCYGWHGMLCYQADGAMYAVFSAVDRPAFGTEALDGGTQDEWARAYGSYISYSGKYTVDESEMVITHHVEFSTFPNWTGRDLVRHCRFSRDGEHLELLTPSVHIGGMDITVQLDFRRSG
ncbi:lipocalin-like domain-containing protein [Saccharopolyspora hattusasensis]|uniref:lipocalin-like domain-containing protein n=1 Tax=Saccharopolyspora hattusasensis TaxID=1128679 RepID=UPI003D98A4E9